MICLQILGVKDSFLISVPLLQSIKWVIWQFIEIVNVRTQAISRGNCRVLFLEYFQIIQITVVCVAVNSVQWQYYLIGTFRYSRAILIFAILLCRNIFLKTKLFFQSGPHLASGVSSVFLSEKENKEALSELCQAFELAHA